MSFEISPNINKNKIFLVNLSELEQRIDPNYYKQEHRKFAEKLRYLKIPATKLKYLSNIVCGPFGSSIKTKDYLESGIPLIRISDIDKDANLQMNKVVFIARELADKLKTYKVEENDILISQRGSLGLVSLVTKQFNGAVISANFIAIKNLKNIIPDYLKIIFILSIGAGQISRKTSGQVQTKITTDDIKSILVPLPSLEIQKEIIEKIDTGYDLKKQKELEAQRSLDSIDDYLLGKLGINLVEPEEKNIQNRIFYRKLSEVSGGRFDGEYYHLSHYQDLVDLKKSSFKLKRLVEVCNRIVDGPFGSSIKAKDYVEKGIPFIRVADVTKGEGYLKTDELIFISDEAHQKILRSRVIPSDVVIAKTGATMGAACVVPKNIPEANIRGDLAALTVKSEQCLPEYVVAFINTKIGQRLFWRLDSGGTRGRVVIGNLEKLPIIIPPLDIQRNIVKRVDEIRDRAKQLRQEAEAELEKAKQEVEAMILGIE